MSYRIYNQNGVGIVEVAESPAAFPYRPGRRRYYIVAVGAFGQESQPVWFETK